MTAVVDRPVAVSAVDADELRLAARLASTAAARYDTAARRLGDRTFGLPRRWRGTAAAAALGELGDLQSRARQAADAYATAADVLTACASRLEDAQALGQRAQALERQDEAERVARAARGAGPCPPDHSPLLQHARRLAGEAQQLCDEALARASHQLRELADCAPRDEHRPLTAGQHVAGFGRGAVDATWSSIVGAAELSLPRMLLDPRGWAQQVRAVGDGTAYAVGHPGDAARSLVGWETLADGRYGEWAGALAPDVLGTVFSGGALPAARRGAELADDVAELAEDVNDLQRVHDRREVQLRPESGGPVEPQAGAVMTPLYPAVIRDLAPDRRVHILDGDPPHVRGGKGGGHRAGTGKPGKTEFPPEWTDDEIIARVMETARHPQRTEDQRPGRDNLAALAEHHGVLIKVVVDPQGNVVTAFPLSGTGVVRNNARSRTP